jgi:hypothetical protein
MGVRMYCRACCYELTGLDAGHADVSAEGEPPETRCPECGRGYKASDGESWQALPRTPFMQFVFGRGGAWFVAFTLILTALWQTWLPRPDAFDVFQQPSMPSWTMWRWFGMRFGHEVDRPNRPSLSVWYVADSPISITGLGYDGEEQWDIKPLGGDRARVRILEPGTDLRIPLAQLTSCQSWPLERFRLVRKRPRAATSPGTGEFEGRWNEILPSLMSHYNLRLVPLRFGEEQQRVVVIDPATGLGRLAPPEEARAMGFDVREFPSGERSMRIGP